jgi:hypothetical protein
MTIGLNTHRKGKNSGFGSDVNDMFTVVLKAEERSDTAASASIPYCLNISHLMQAPNLDANRFARGRVCASETLAGGCRHCCRNTSSTSNTSSGNTSNTSSGSS